MNLRALIPVGVCWSTALGIWAFGCQNDSPQPAGSLVPPSAPIKAPAQAPAPVAAPDDEPSPAAPLEP